MGNAPAAGLPGGEPSGDWMIGAVASPTSGGHACRRDAKDRHFGSVDCGVLTTKRGAATSWVLGAVPHVKVPRQASL